MPRKSKPLMLTEILEFVKEVKTWTARELVKVSAIVIIAVAGYFVVRDLIDTKSELRGLKQAHEEEIREVRKASDLLFNEQRRKFQEEIDSYVLKHNQDKERAAAEFNKKLEQNENELIKLRREIKAIKNEISK